MESSAGLANADCHNGDVAKTKRNESRHQQPSRRSDLSTYLKVDNVFLFIMRPLSIDCCITVTFQDMGSLTEVKAR